MFEEGLFGKVIHVRKVNHGQWRAMKEYEEDFEKMMAHFAVGWRMKW